MIRRNQLSLLSGLLFAVTGLVMGALIGWFAANSWLGVGFLIILIMFYISMLAEIDFLGDIAAEISRPVWKSIAVAGERWAGTDPSLPVDLALRLIFAAAFLIGLGMVMLAEFPWLMGRT